MSKDYDSGLFGITKEHIISVIDSLPKDWTKLLSCGWENISHPSAAKVGSYKLQEKSSGLIIRFDEGKSGVSGFRGQNHYHIENPNATGNSNMYLDKNGDPVAKGSKASHILP